MKKFLFAVVCMMCLCSCLQNHRQQEGNVVRNIDEENKFNDMTDNAFDKVKEFEYKGHQYIKFDTNVNGGACGVVHNPDCKCHKAE